MSTHSGDEDSLSFPIQQPQSRKAGWLETALEFALPPSRLDFTLHEFEINSLKQENGQLLEQNAALRKETAGQKATIQNQAGQIKALQAQLAELQKQNLTLINDFAKLVPNWDDHTAKAGPSHQLEL